jgi:hypothetical protein
VVVEKINSKHVRNCRIKIIVLSNVEVYCSVGKIYFSALSFKIHNTEVSITAINIIVKIPTPAYVNKG